MGSLEICNHCKKQYEFYLNYNSESNFSLWADMMEKNLEWNKQQNFEDENHETIHSIKFKKCTKIPGDNGPLFLERRGKSKGIDEKSKPSKI